MNDRLTDWTDGPQPKMDDENFLFTIIFSQIKADQMKALLMPVRLVFYFLIYSLE